MKEITCYKIEDEVIGKSWTFANISEAEAEELYLAFLEGAIEEDIMETQRIEYFNRPIGGEQKWIIRKKLINFFLWMASSICINF